MTSRNSLIRLPVLVLSLALAGCTTASLLDAAPEIAEPVPPPPPRDVVTGEAALAIAAEQPDGVVNSNQFPNLNAAPARHEGLISTEQEAEDIARLAQQRDALAAGAAGNNDAAAAEAARLRALGATHADDVIRQIETP